MKTRFSKMHGAGNDFVVFDATRASLSLSAARIRRIADRQRGIGCDQVLVVEASHDPEIDFVYRIFNADGSEVGQCGNGARAFARFVADQGLSDKTVLRVRTASGVISPRLLQDGRVMVDMGPPSFLPADVPFIEQGLAAMSPGPAYRYTVQLDSTACTFSVCSMGNPHAVLQVADCAGAAVRHVGPLLESDARFPLRVNVGFVQAVDAHHVLLRVWERGAGETLACGSGACAAVAVGIAQGWLRSPVEVQTQGGALEIAWSGALGEAVLMSGPAVTVYEGEIDLQRLDGTA